MQLQLIIIVKWLRVVKLSSKVRAIFLCCQVLLRSLSFLSCTALEYPWIFLGVLLLPQALFDGGIISVVPFFLCWQGVIHAWCESVLKYLRNILCKEISRTRAKISQNFSVRLSLFSANFYFTTPCQEVMDPVGKAHPQQPEINSPSLIQCWKLQSTCLRVKYIKQISGFASWPGSPLMWFLALCETKQQMERGKASPLWAHTGGFGLGVQQNGRRWWENSSPHPQTSRILQKLLKKGMLA